MKGELRDAVAEAEEMYTSALDTVSIAIFSIPRSKKHFAIIF